MSLKVCNPDVRKESRARPPFCILFSTETADNIVTRPGHRVHARWTNTHIGDLEEILGELAVNANCLEIQFKMFLFKYQFFHAAITQFTLFRVSNNILHGDFKE